MAVNLALSFNIVIWQYCGAFQCHMLNNNCHHKEFFAKESTNLCICV